MRKDLYPIDYDNNWKEIVSGMFEDFLAFFMPKLYDDTDFDYPVEFLEQELYDILQVTDKDRVVDKLAKVRLKNGEDRWVFVHIEFQTSSESDFSQRMYRYYQLIRAKYEKDVTAIVIYTGKRKPRLYDHYKEDNYGTSILYRFNTYSIIKQDESELLANPNPFAIVVLANFYVLKTTATQTERLTFKEQVYQLARQRGYTDEKTAKLLLFIDELMRLNTSLHQIFKNHLHQYSNPLPDMFKYSQDTLEILDVEAKIACGLTITELFAAKNKAEAKAEEAETKVKQTEAKAEEAEAKVKQTEARAEEAEAKVSKTVITLYKKFQLSIDQIAAELDETAHHVRSILIKAGAIND